MVRTSALPHLLIQPRRGCHRISGARRPNRPDRHRCCYGLSPRRFSRCVVDDVRLTPYVRGVQRTQPPNTENDGAMWLASDWCTVEGELFISAVTATRRSQVKMTRCLSHAKQARVGPATLGKKLYGVSEFVFSPRGAGIRSFRRSLHRTGGTPRVFGQALAEPDVTRSSP
jgi:hypothetical protein